MRWHLALILTAVAAVLVLAIVENGMRSRSRPSKCNSKPMSIGPSSTSLRPRPCKRDRFLPEERTPFSSRCQRSCFDYRDDDGGPAVFYRVADGRWVNQSHRRSRLLTPDAHRRRPRPTGGSDRNNLTIDLRSSGRPSLTKEETRTGVFAFFPSARHTGSRSPFWRSKRPATIRGHRGKWIMS